MTATGLAFGAVVVAAAAPLGWAAHLTATRLVARDGARPPGPGLMIGAAMLMAAAAWLAEPRAGLLADLGLGWPLLVLAAVDLATLRLPDVLTLPLAVAGLLATAAGLTGAAAPLSAGPLLDHALGAAIGFGALAGLAFGYRRLRGREGLGMGDAKLAAAGGAWLGAMTLPAMVLIACAAAFVWVGVRLLRDGRAALDAPLPFGPPLAAAIWIAWLAPLAPP